jgi:uncharacterized protein (TIGR00375 family)
MKFIADFHIHSHFSIATSKWLVPEHLDYWARLKGITVVGSGDFSHPGWVKELKEKLEPAEPGLFRLKEAYRLPEVGQMPGLNERPVRFCLTAEISNIYKKHGAVRKVHNVIFAPDFDTVEKIQQKLRGIGGNITSDGRPILGLDSRDLLEMALEASERIFFVPAHIWTPWFSILGDKSGFDSVEACFDDLADHIYAVETGLSTDPAMNWMCGFLDRYTLTANSDAHSPDRLGRNANLFDTELDYDAIIAAVKAGDGKDFLGTIDLFPQEGKYHYDGHRKCGVCWDPVETLKHRAICTKCGKRVTVGVMNRVVQLADREDILLRRNRRQFYSIIPLKEILAEIVGVAPNSRKVAGLYLSSVKKIGPELDLLLNVPLEEINRGGGSELSEAVSRMRSRRVYIKEGYDGEYGQIKVFGQDEKGCLDAQTSLFQDWTQAEQPGPPIRRMINFDLDEYRRLRAAADMQAEAEEKAAPAVPVTGGATEDLSPQQQAAVAHFNGPALIIAGPGTGKTRVVAHRIRRLVERHGVEPAHILAVTFTNRAAGEMRERLEAILPEAGEEVLISTFHGLGLTILKTYCPEVGRQKNFSIIDEDDRERILKEYPGGDKKQVRRFSTAVREAKLNLKSPSEVEEPELRDMFGWYEDFLRDQNLFDLEDLIYQPVLLLEGSVEIADHYRSQYRWLTVDEYQDINLLQYRLIRSLLPAKDANLCVVGDPDQAIYGFRGADVGFIRKFSHDYPGAAVYRLQRSYRCSDAILKASGEVVGAVESSLKGLIQGVKIKIVENATHRSEAEFVARTIEQMMGGLRFFSMDSSISGGSKEAEIESLSDFAVLCRVKAQMEALERAFNDHSIPSQTVGDDPFFKQEPVKSVIDLLKLQINPDNRFLADRLTAAGVISPLNPLEFDWRQSEGGQTVKDMVAAIIDGYFSRLRTENEKSFERLLELAGQFGEDVEKFLAFAALGTGADDYCGGLEYVTLLTLHAAKGLEFECVFIVGCEEGLLPYSLFENRQSDPAEERRLLYVGMTRAKKFLFLSHAGKRVIFGRPYRLKRSPFLDPIHRELVELTKTEHKKKETPTEIQLKLFDM